jgi:3-dehydroquinate synthase
MSTVAVSLAGRSYDIVIGPALIDRAGELSAGLLASRRVIVVTDETVAPLYGARVVAAFKNAGIVATTVTVPAGERAKEFAAFGQLMNALLDQRPDRKTTLVA